MKILITGGAGYLGKSLYTFLRSKKLDVTVVTRKDVDLTDTLGVSKWFSGKYFDVVLHTAVTGGSRLRANSSVDLVNNLNMYYNLVNCSNHFGKLIHFGSGAEVYNKYDYYGLSKYVINEDIQHRDNFYNIRIYAVFDENELTTRFIKANLIKYINREPLVIHSNKLMDFYYMEDLQTLVEHYIKKTNLPKIIECTYSTHYSLLEIANFINKVDKHTVPIVIQTNNESTQYIGNFQDLNLNLVGLFKGIKKTYRNLTKHNDTY